MTQQQEIAFLLRELATQLIQTAATIESGNSQRWTHKNVGVKLKQVNMLRLAEDNRTREEFAKAQTLIERVRLSLDVQSELGRVG